MINDRPLTKKALIHWDSATTMRKVYLIYKRKTTKPMYGLS